MTHLDRSWPPPPQFVGRSRRNISEMERWMSGLGGAALAAWALQRRTPDAWAAGAGALGAMLLYRASTAHCAVYAAAGISTADGTNTRAALSGPRGVIVESSVTVNRPASELYAFWRTLDNLPRVMQHLQSVTVFDERRSRWVAAAPLGTTVEWEAEIINDVPGKVIGWRGGRSGHERPGAAAVRPSRRQAWRVGGVGARRGAVGAGRKRSPAVQGADGGVNGRGTSLFLAAARSLSLVSPDGAQADALSRPSFG
jgi:uncharacterized membrane protein